MEYLEVEIRNEEKMIKRFSAYAIAVKDALEKKAITSTKGQEEE